MITIDELLAILTANKGTVKHCTITYGTEYVPNKNTEILGTRVDINVNIFVPKKEL